MTLLRLLNSKWSLKILTTFDNLALQTFLNLFEDFFLLCEGKAGTAEELLGALPPTKGLEDKTVLGIYEGPLLMGLLDLVQDYPERGTWTIGYFIMHPAFRGQGIGDRFLQDLSDALQSLGALKLRCIVQHQNPRARLFWTNHGFVVKGQVDENFILEKSL